MKLRQYKPYDRGKLWKLFFDTVHSINAKDYTDEQLNAWAPKDTDGLAWEKSHITAETVVAFDGDEIIGFGYIDAKAGYLDLLYVHKDHIGKGIGTAICNELEKRSRSNVITTHASITAKPFFEKRGYTIVKDNDVERNGVVLRNYMMKKTLDILSIL